MSDQTVQRIVDAYDGPGMSGRAEQILAAHDREVAAKALRDAADTLDRPRVIWYGDGGVTVLEAGADATLDDYRAERPTVVEWLRARADRLTETSGEGTA